MGKWTYDKLCHAKGKELDQVVQNGRKPSLETLQGYEWRGYNVLPPHAYAVMWLLENTRFIKCFLKEPTATDDDGQPTELAGYNLKVTRGGTGDPWTTKPSEEKPLKIGKYRVLPDGDRGKYTGKYDNAVFLDYDVPDNNLFDGRTIKDFIVHPDDNDDLIVGKAIFHLGPISTPSFFILERYQEHNR